MHRHVCVRVFAWERKHSISDLLRDLDFHLEGIYPLVFHRQIQGGKQTLEFLKAIGYNGVNPYNDSTFYKFCYSL